MALGRIDRMQITFFLLCMNKQRFNEAVQLIFDFSMAYDSSSRDEIYKILFHQGMPGKCMKLLNSRLYWSKGCIA